MQPRHTSQPAIVSLPKPSRGIRTHVGSISGTINQLSYDGFGRLAQLKYKSPNQQTLLQRQYQYDPMSNITRVDENKAASNIANNTLSSTSNAYVYQYDKLYRLTSTDNPTGLPDEQYTYDKLGNRLTDNGKPNPAQTSKQWQYNANNQLTQSATEDSATFGSNARAINHSYDGNGNQTQLATATGTELANPYNNQQYRYDAQNRLTAVTDSAGNLIASYQYDPYGQRIRKTIHRILITDSSNPNVGTWQLLTTPNTFNYFYRDEGLSAEYQTAGQDITTPNSTTPATNITTPKLISQYGWLPNGVWGTNPIWINTSKRTTTTANNQTTTTISPPDYYYYQNDHLGTPQQLIDTQGNIVWQQKSTAFGETSISQQSITNNFRFAGQYFDAETNTNYNYHRQYNPANGNYTQTDPIGLAGGMNRQGYVGGNPLRFIDSSGLLVGYLGFGGGGWAGPAFGQVFAGIVVDYSNGSFHAGAYGTVADGFGLGGDGFAGVTGGFLYSKGKDEANIHDFAGPFITGTAGAGFGGHVTIDGFFDPNNTNHRGGGVVIGPGVGAGGGVGVSETGVITPQDIIDWLKRKFPKKPKPPKPYPYLRPPEPEPLCRD